MQATTLVKSLTPDSGQSAGKSVMLLFMPRQCVNRRRRRQRKHRARSLREEQRSLRKRLFRKSWLRKSGMYWMRVPPERRLRMKNANIRRCPLLLTRGKIQFRRMRNPLKPKKISELLSEECCRWKKQKMRQKNPMLQQRKL